MALHVADLYEAVAAAVPERPAVSCGGCRLTFAELDRRADAVPELVIGDGFGASESGVDKQSRVGDDGLMRLRPTPRVTVVDDRFRPVQPGSEDIGFVARSGHVPLGYHNDPAQ